MAVLGGISINIEGSADLFMPLMFRVYTEGCPVDRLDVFGDSRLLPGCINFSYLQSLLGEQKIDEESRFKTA